MYKLPTPDIALPQRHLQRIQRQVGAHVPGQPPPDDEPGETVNDERGVHRAGGDRHVGEVRDPPLVGRRRSEVPPQQVRTPGRSRPVRHGGPPPRPPPADPADAQPAHQAFHRAAGHLAALAVQLLPDLASPVDLVVLVVDLDDQRDQLLIPPGPRRRRATLDLVVRRRRDLHTGLAQHPADRFDTAEPAPMFVDECDYLGSRGSNSRAKKAEAAFRISLARLSSRTSRSNSAIRCESTVDVPGRLPPSISACLTQLRSVSRLIPNRSATRAPAPCCCPDSSRLSTTIRTARSRTSSGYFFGAGMTPTFARLGVSNEPGAAHLPAPADRSVHPPNRDDHVCDGSSPWPG